MPIVHVPGSRLPVQREGFPDFVCAFHERDDSGPRMLACIAKRVAIRPEGLRSPGLLLASLLRRPTR
jgi:hypothetical protein